MKVNCEGLCVFLNEEQLGQRVIHVIEEDRKENREPKPASSGYLQAINKKTPITDTTATILNKINPISNMSSDVVQLVRKQRCFKWQK